MAKFVVPLKLMVSPMGLFGQVPGTGNKPRSMALLTESFTGGLFAYSFPMQTIEKNKKIKKTCKGLCICRAESGNAYPDHGKLQKKRVTKQAINKEIIFKSQQGNTF